MFKMPPNFPDVIPTRLSKQLDIRQYMQCLHQKYAGYSMGTST